MSNPVKIYQPEAINIFEENTTIHQLATGFRFAEGPLWHPDGFFLFSDTPANRIFSIYLNGIMNEYLHHSGGHYIVHTHLSDMIGSNGLALDKHNHLVFCQQGNHSIAKMDKAKHITRLCTSYNGKPFNSPNDVVIKSDGAIFFTDPPYGLKGEVLHPRIFQPHAGLYKFFDNQVTLVNKDLNYPNGLCFSQDEKCLFVSSNHPDEKIIYRYDCSASGKISNRQVFARMNADGIKTDRYDNLLCATSDGVVILSREGKKIASIKLPSMATNLAFGGSKNDILFITTPDSVYHLQMKYTGDAKRKPKFPVDKLPAARFLKSRMSKIF